MMEKLNQIRLAVHELAAGLQNCLRGFSGLVILRCEQCGALRYIPSTDLSREISCAE